MKLKEKDKWGGVRKGERSYLYIYIYIYIYVCVCVCVCVCVSACVSIQRYR